MENAKCFQSFALLYPHTFISTECFSNKEAFWLLGWNSNVLALPVRRNVGNLQGIHNSKMAAAVHAKVSG